MIAKLFVTLVLFFSFVVTCQSQDTLKVTDSTNQDSIIIKQYPIILNPLAQNCKKYSQDVLNNSMSKVYNFPNQYKQNDKFLLLDKLTMQTDNWQLVIIVNKSMLSSLSNKLLEKYINLNLASKSTIACFCIKDIKILKSIRRNLKVTYTNGDSTTSEFMMLIYEGTSLKFISSFDIVDNQMQFQNDIYGLVYAPLVNIYPIFSNMRHCD